MSELSENIEHPAGITELLGMGTIPTHLVTGSLRSEAFCVSGKGETHKKVSFPYSGRLLHSYSSYIVSFNW